MDKRYPERNPIKISLFELPKRFNALNILVEKQNISHERELSIQAGAIVAKIYNGLKNELKIQSDTALSDLNKLCVRLVFCLYAESIDIFRQVGGREVEEEKLLLNCRNCKAMLADLYDKLTMPSDLRAAYRKNDVAVAKTYGFESILDDEPAIVAALMKMYESLTRK